MAAHRLLIVVVGLAILCAPQAASAQEKRPNEARAWTLDEILPLLQFYPRDTYLQYVALQLARRENRVPMVTAELERRNREFGRGFAGDRQSDVDLFSVFSGALAVQESLQLDTMRGEANRNSDPARDAKRAEKVQLSELSGPTIKSHPWEEMLGTKQPEISPLSHYVPADFYFLEFRSLGKLLDLMDAGDLWGRHLFNQAQQEARTHFLGQKLKQQLAVETNPLLRPFYDQVVTDVAVVGSDLFVREGSDVTLLFRFQFPDVFKARMDQFLTNVAQAFPDVRRDAGEIQGVRFVHLSTPDRSVEVYSAYPIPGLHVRTNSRVALQRIVAAIQGKDTQGNAVERLGDTSEFAYIRTLMPRGAPEEDGFIYLSDPFIRQVIGPQLKLTERRRMLCYNHLRMIGHAALMYHTEQGRTAQSIGELEAAKCTPGKFGEDALACPDNGKYALSSDGITGVCSHHGHAKALKPCCEIPLTEVSGVEAEEYKRFLEQYNQYWRTFFDPIAIRVKVTPQRYRLETIVLPLIDNSIYSGLVRVIGGTPQSLEVLPVPKRNIFSIAVHINKENLLQEAGLPGLLEEEAGDKPAVQKQLSDTVGIARNLQQLGLAMHNYHDTYRRFPTAVRFDKDGKRNRLSWRVHLLPFLGEQDLYQQFKLDEPWDSEHNRKLVPAIPTAFQSSKQQLNAKGMTKLVAPVADKAIFSTTKEDVDMAKIVDGTSNTILLVEADDAHAVEWTRPDDLEVKREQPLAGLQIREPGAVLVLLADGSHRFMRSSLEKEQILALMTRDGMEQIRLQENDLVALRIPNERRPYGISMEMLEQLQLGQFLSRGIGDQLGFHVYDAEPQFDVSLPNFLGRSLGSLQRSRFDDEVLWISFLVASLTAPVYVDVPVKDAAIVDQFLERLDHYLTAISRGGRGPLDWFGLQADFYHLDQGGDTPTRSYTLQIGPVKMRFFFARIGNGLYLASQPFILDDLRAAQATAKSSAPANLPTAHAMVRLRPENWQRVLTGYKLGWAENNRQACLHNLGPLSHVCRAISGNSTKPGSREFDDLLQRSAARVYDTQFFCPEGGRYLPAADGMRVTCSVHGSVESPRQSVEPAKDSELGRLIQDFADMTLSLSFLEDGLHTVVTIDRH